MVDELSKRRAKDNYFITFIALAFILSTNVMAAESRDQVADLPNENQEVRIESKTAPESDRKFHYGFQVGGSNNGIKKDNTRYFDDSYLKKPSAVLKTGVEYDLNKTFSTRISLGFQAQSEKGNTEHDTSVTDASGQTFNLVERKFDYSNIEAGISPSLIHNIRLGSSWNIRNIISFGYALGKEEYEEAMKTDRNHWSPFTNHNRYTLNSKRTYERLSVSYGIEAVFKIFVISVEARRSKINTKSLKNTSSMDGEYFAFGDDAYDFASYRNEVQDFIIGVGMRF